MIQRLRQRVLDFAAQVSGWWWRLWTGQPSLEAKRREIEDEARRFGGDVTWKS